MANIFKHVQERINCGSSQLGVTRMSQLTPGYQLETKRSLACQAQLVLRRLTVNQIARTARRFCRNARTCAVSFFADHKQKAQIRNALNQKFLSSATHRGDDPLGIACPAPPEKFALFA